METAKRKSSSSGSSDSGYDLRHESLKKWEDNLKSRELEIERLEKKLRESESLLKKEEALRSLERQLAIREKDIEGICRTSSGELVAFSLELIQCIK